MLIKHKLITNTAVTIVSMLAMLFLMNYASSSLKRDITLAQDIGKIEAGIFQLRTSEKDFLSRKAVSYIEQFNAQVLKLQLNIKNLKQKLKSIDISPTEAIKLSSLLNNYQHFFHNVVEAQKRIGLNLQSGFNGDLRNAAIEAEKAIGDSVMFFKTMLQIRSSEKNYMLLLDDQYIEQFNKDFALLQSDVKDSYLVSSKKKAILKALTTYKNAFSSLVSEQQILGYHDNEGYQKALNDSAAQVITMQENLVAKTDAAVNEYVGTIKRTTYILFAVALFISILIGWILSRNIMNAILHIKDSIMQISETNDLTIEVSTKNNDELADMAKAFNYMISNFQNLLVSVKEAGSDIDGANEILAENPLWADFIYEECLEGELEPK